MKIGIFYGSTTGTTEGLASQIASKLDISMSDVHDVSSVPAEKTSDYDALLLGSSTWGFGELQDDWFDFLESLKGKDLSGKKVGLFGCGDAESYDETFCDALALIQEDLSGTGCTFIGSYAPDGYSLTDCKINQGGKFIGLAIDDVNDSDLTDARIDSWVSALKGDL